MYLGFNKCVFAISSSKADTVLNVEPTALLAVMDMEIYAERVCSCLGFMFAAPSSHMKNRNLNTTALVSGTDRCLHVSQVDGKVLHRHNSLHWGLSLNPLRPVLCCQHKQNYTIDRPSAAWNTRAERLTIANRIHMCGQYKCHFVHQLSDLGTISLKACHTFTSITHQPLMGTSVRFRGFA